MKLIKELDFVPLDKIVVTFDKFRTFPTEQTVVDKDAKENEGKDPINDEVKTKKITVKAKYNIQEAKVLGVPANETTIAVGDIVVVDMRYCMDLQGYKDIFVVTKYNILGIKTPENN